MELPSLVIDNSEPQYVLSRFKDKGVLCKSRDTFESD